MAWCCALTEFAAPLVFVTLAKQMLLSNRLTSPGVVLIGWRSVSEVCSGSNQGCRVYHSNRCASGETLWNFEQVSLRTNDMISFTAGEEVYHMLPARSAWRSPSFSIRSGADCAKHECAALKLERKPCSVAKLRSNRVEMLSVSISSSL
jgi:hypothetical protein